MSDQRPRGVRSIILLGFRLLHLEYISTHHSAAISPPFIDSTPRSIMSTAQRCRSPSTPAIVYYFGSVLLLNAILRSAPVSVATDLVVVIDEKEQKKQKEKKV